MRRIIALIPLLIALAACEPVVAAGTDYEPHLLTSDGDDVLAIAGDSTFTAVFAPLSNADDDPPEKVVSNYRAAFLPAGVAPSSTHTVCSTWIGSTHDIVQQGLVLRYDPTTATAVTVTKNIWANAYDIINVHTWDLSVSPASFTLVASYPLASLAGVPALPWRACATATPSDVTFTVYPLSLPEPPLGDPCCIRVTPLPSSVVGRPGIYTGHVQPGHVVAFGAITTS